MTETMAQKPATTRIPRQLRESDVHGKGAAEIGWGTHGDFDRCRAFMRRHDVPAHEIDGACANLHRIATGEWPGPNAHKGHLASVAVISLTAAAGPADEQMIRWHGPLAVVGEPTGDRRRFPNDTLKYQSFPQPWRFQRQGLPGHQGAITVGVIEGAKEQMYTGDQKELQGKRVIYGHGYFLDPDVIPEVKEAIHLAEHGVSGPSVDLDSYTAVLKKNTMSGETTADMVRGRMRAATLVPVPAFADLRITVVRPKALVASAAEFTVNSAGWRGSPIAPREALFDADDAAKRIEAWANGDPAKMAKMFLWVDTQNGPLLGRKGYRLPWGDIIDDKPYLIYHAVYAAAALLQGGHGGLPNIPDDEKGKLRSVVSEIYQDLATEFDDPSIQAPWDHQEQQQQAAGLPETGDEFDDYIQAYDGALEEFVRTNWKHRYVESKHPRDHRKDKHAGEWIDTPHGPHGEIKVGSKWVYPPKRGEKGYKSPEASARAIAKRGGGTQVGKKRPEPKSDAGRQRHTVKEGPSDTERMREADKKRAEQLREVAGVKKGTHVGRKVAEPKKAARKPKAELTDSQQKALEALHADENAKVHAATKAALTRRGYLDENGKLTDKAHKHLGVKETKEPEKKAPEVKAPEKKTIVGKKVGREKKSGQEHADAIKDLKSREEVDTYLKGLTGPELRETLKAQDRKPEGRRVQELRDQIAGDWGMKHKLKEAKGPEVERVDEAPKKEGPKPGPGRAGTPAHEAARKRAEDRKDRENQNAARLVAKRHEEAKKRQAAKADEAVAKEDAKKAAKAEPAGGAPDKKVARLEEQLKNLKGRLGLAEDRRKARKERQQGREEGRIRAQIHEKERELDAARRGEEPKKATIIAKKNGQPKEHKLTAAQQSALDRLREDENAKVHPATKKILQREGYLDENGKLTDKGAGGKAPAKAAEAPKAPEPKAAAPKAAPAKQAPAEKAPDAPVKATPAKKGNERHSTEQRARIFRHMDARQQQVDALQKRLDTEKLDRNAHREVAARLESAKNDLARLRELRDGGKDGYKPGGPAIPAGRKSDEAKMANSWGAGEQNGKVHFHEDGAIGTGIRHLGADADLEVDGDRLDNVLGKIATDGVAGRITPQQQLEQLTDLQRRLPAGRAKQIVSTIVEDLGAPARARPGWFGDAPQPIQDLVDDLRQIPIARGGALVGGHKEVEMDRLDQIMGEWKDGKLSPLRLKARVRSLVDLHHESQEGKIAVDHAVGRALARLDAMDRNDLMPPHLRDEKAAAAEAKLKIRVEQVMAGVADGRRRHEQLQREVAAAEGHDELDDVLADVRYQQDRIREDLAALDSAIMQGKGNDQIVATRRKLVDQLEAFRELDRVGEQKKKEIPTAPKPEAIGDPDSDKLGKKFSSGDPSDRKGVAEGAQGRKEILTYADGTKIFHKEFNQRGLGRPGVEEADAEELASLMGRAIGARVPVVHRNGERDILMNHIDGKNLELLPGLQVREHEGSHDGVLIGLLDFLIGNTDRHRGNMMVDKQGRLHGIDHGLAWATTPDFEAQHRDPYGPMRGIVGDSNRLSPADIKKLTQRLEALRPAFRKRGKEEWLDFSLKALADLGKRAHGKEDMIS